MRRVVGAGVGHLRLLVVCVALVAGCTRPLAEGERAFAQDVFGEGLDLDRVRVAQGFDPLPKAEAQAQPPEPSDAEPAPIRPGLCDRVAPDAPKGPPPGFALYNSVRLADTIYLPDTMAGWPDQILLPQGFVMIHELVHIWQWQNRKTTRYRPARAVLEQILRRDPYFYVPQEGAGLLEYGFEQQAALLEDYFCYVIFDPKNERRGRIREIIAPHFRVDRIDEILAR